MNTLRWILWSIAAARGGGFVSLVIGPNAFPKSFGAAP